MVHSGSKKFGPPTAIYAKQHIPSTTKTGDRQLSSSILFVRGSPVLTHEDVTCNDVTTIKNLLSGTDVIKLLNVEAKHSAPHIPSLMRHSGMKDTLSRYWRKPDKQAAHTTALLRGSIKEYVESIPREQMELGKK